jgi:hypothetical protein
MSLGIHPVAGDGIFKEHPAFGLELPAQLVEEVHQSMVLPAPFAHIWKTARMAPGSKLNCHGWR